jgi:hypothetical protein
MVEFVIWTFRVDGIAIIVAVLVVIITSNIHVKKMWNYAESGFNISFPPGSTNDFNKEKQFQKLNAKKEDRLVKVVFFSW